jgi:hypothetical protein
MEIIPDKRKLIGLVEQGGQGKLCLPNFQRDFVWTRDEIADLLRSILRGYFVGSLLLLRCDPDRPPFAPVSLRGATPTTTALRPEWLILDGQQRLTSLLYALTSPGLSLKNSKNPRSFYVDLDALAADPDDDAIVVDRTVREARRDGLNEPEGQWRAHKLPCTTLLRERDFLRWRDGIDDWLHETDTAEHQRFRDEWREPWTEAVGAFQAFEVPVVELPRVDDEDVDAIARVCAIFEKLNSTGVELSVYDLLTARLFRSRIDLHALWDESVELHPRLAEWSEGSADTNKFGVLVLRTLALMRDLEPKPKMLINLAPKDFEDDWRRATAAIERALDLLEHVGPDGFGVFNKKWLPGYGLLPVLAALRAYIEERRLGNEPRADLRRWYWSSVFLERYSSTVETKSRRDYTEFTRRWGGATTTPTVFAEAEARIGATGYSVRESASYASSVYSGVFCLLAIGGARDWAAAETIELQKLEDHHLFPRNYLTTRGLDSARDKTIINSIVNRTLISDATNKLISNKAPAEYLSDARVFPRSPETLLPAHFVDAAALTLMRDATKSMSGESLKDIYRRFSDARETAIISAIRRACGVTETATPPSAELLDDE